MAAALTTDPAPTKTPPAIPLTGCAAVRHEASKYKGWSADVIQAIAHAESHCNITATGDGHLTFYQHGRRYGYSVSVLQVRILPGRESCDAHNLQINVKCAYAVWKSQGYAAWTKYNNGEYRQFLWWHTRPTRAYHANRCADRCANARLSNLNIGQWDEQHQQRL